MKRENIVTFSAISLVALAAIAGFAYYSFAATTGKETGLNASSINQFGYGRHWQGNNLTSEQKAQLETNRAAAETKHEAVEKAVEANDYTGWVAAITQINANAPILEKINAENFAKLVEAHTYREKAQTILQELGLEGQGFGLGLGQGGKGGFGRMMSGGGMMGGWGGPGDADDN